MKKKKERIKGINRRSEGVYANQYDFKIDPIEKEIQKRNHNRSETEKAMRE